MTIYLSDVGDSSSISDLTKELMKSVEYLFVEFRVRHLMIINDHLNIDFDGFVNMLHDSCMSKTGPCSLIVHWERKGVRIIRRENVQFVEVPDSSRHIGIYSVSGTETAVVSPEHYDCRILQKEHIKQSSNLSIALSSIRKDDAKEISEKKTSAQFAQTCLHILETFHPSMMNFNLPATGVDTYKGTMVLDDGAVYCCSWTSSGGRSVVCFTRQPDALVLAVPNSKRNIQVYPSKDVMNIMTKELTDCMVLRNAHIQQPTENKIHVSVNTTIKPDIDVVRTTAGWQETCRHLLETFKPRVLTLNVSRLKSNIRSDVFYMVIGDGTFYHCSLILSGKYFFLTRVDKTVDVPNTSRSIKIHPGSWGMTIVADQFSDLQVLREEHIEKMGEGNLRVYTECVPYNENETADLKPCDSWQQTVKHLVHTFCPPSINIKVTRPGSKRMIDRIFYMQVEEGVFYQWFWSKDWTTLYLTRMDNIQTVRTPDTWRDVGIYKKGDKAMVIVADHLADCMALQKTHLNEPEECTLSVYLNCLLDKDEATHVNRTAGWQKTLSYLLETFHPLELVIRVLKSESNIKEEGSFINLDDSMVYHGFWSKTNTQYNLYRIDRAVDVPTTSRSIKFHPGSWGMTIVAEQFSDCLVLREEHIEKMGEGNLTVYTECVPYDNEKKIVDLKPCDSWQQTVKHLVHTLCPPSINIKVTMPGSKRMIDGIFYMQVEKGVFYQWFWSKDGTTLYLTRKESFHTVRIPGTLRCAGIYKKGDKEIVIVADKLSDCMALQKEHLMEPGERNLDIHLDCLLDKNGDQEPDIDLTIGWQNVFNHLLEICHPPGLFINVLKTRSGITGDRFNIVLDDGALYRGSGWSETNTRYYLFRRENVNRIDVPNTSRYVRTDSGTTGKDVVILVEQLCDLNILQKRNIEHSGEQDFVVYLNSVLSQKADDPNVNHFSGWQQAFRHLLQTYNPPWVHVNGIKRKSDLPEGNFHLMLSNGTWYKSTWGESNNSLMFQRLENVSQIDVPNTSRCIRTYKRNTKVNAITILVEQLSDLNVLEKEHIEHSREHTLVVYLNSILSQNVEDNPNGTRCSGWKEALHHLLKTYNPLQVWARGIKNKSDIQEGIFHSASSDNIFYESHWGKAGTVFVLQRMPKPENTFTRTFTAEGGVLQNLAVSDVVLTVPEGAILPGESVAVCVRVYTHLMDFGEWIGAEKNYIISPVVDCMLNRKMVFERPVTIKIPLCVTPKETSDVKVLHSVGCTFEDLAQDKSIKYDVVGNCLNIQTAHFTKFLVTAEKTVNIQSILLTLAAQHKSQCALELRIMAHTNCHQLKDFQDHRAWGYPTGMKEIDSRQVQLPEEEDALTFPKIEVKLIIRKGCPWSILDIKGGAEDKLSEQTVLVRGKDILKIEDNPDNSGSKPLTYFYLEGHTSSEMMSSLHITFHYEREGLGPLEETFLVTLPSGVNPSIDVNANPDEQLAVCGEPWSKGSDGAMELLDRQLKQDLRTKVPTLKETLELEDMWADLKAREAITQATINRLTLNATSEQIVEKFFEYLERGPRWRFHTFLRVAATTNNEHIVYLLGFDSKFYSR